MGNANRYRNGTRLLVQVPVASATVIEKGDLVLLSGGKATTPSQLFGQGSEKATAAALRSAVADAFLGIAETASASGDTADVMVDVSLDSVYELQQASAAAVSFGDKIEVHAHSTASASYSGADDSVAAGSTDPIAVCTREHTAAQGTGTRCKLLPQKLLRSASWNG